MTKLALVAVLAALTVPGLSTLAYGQSVEDTILGMYGEFEIGNGQTKTLAYGKHDRIYRICVRQHVESVPLKVMHDGLESLVYPGDCADVEGTRIDVTPNAQLDQGMVLRGRYEHLRADSSG